MNKKEAKIILKDSLTENGDLSCISMSYVDWNKGSENGTLDGVFDLEELEAIVTLMKE